MVLVIAVCVCVFGCVYVCMRVRVLVTAEWIMPWIFDRGGEM